MAGMRICGLCSSSAPALTLCARIIHSKNGSDILPSAIEGSYPTSVAVPLQEARPSARSPTFATYLQMATALNILHVT
eukprot:5914836-Amphidinium_carterae.1